MLRAIVIDDEQAGIETLGILAARHMQQVRIVASATKPEAGITFIEDYRPDVVFLDISMPVMNGFELLNRLAWRHFSLVFTTAHRDYAIEAIRHRAADYLLKPITEADFTACMQRITTKQAAVIPAVEKKAGPQLLEVPVKDGIEFLQQQHIVWLEASRSYTIFHMEGQARRIASKSLKEFEPKLNSSQFFRCHHSHIINLYKVSKFINHDGLYAQMTDGSRVDVSKKSRDAFLERLKTI